ncbi:MAG: ATP-binding cassette domain-containing protein, partial [Fuerstia sp.]|nr:ATP-binding cassette domain-containing protein [Fuerstiella sp.]
MSGSLFHLRDVTLPATGGRQSPDCDSFDSRSVAKHDQGVSTPRLPGARLNSITLQIPCGATAVVGLSGAGKTSLLNVLAGFETGFTGELKSSPPEGTAHRLPLYWVPQNGGLWPHLSAEQHLEIVGLVAEHSGGGQMLQPATKDSATSKLAPNQRSSVESGRFSKRTDEILQLFDLTHRRQALPAELSQGERSRLALARALATRASVLLLDEPLSHVDPVRKPTYWNIVRRTVAEENISMIFTSHEPETVLRHAEHVICLHEGAVAFEGSVRTLYDDPPNAMLGAFLGPLNWFRADEAAAFLARHEVGMDVAVRPERLQIQFAAESGIELVSTPFIGMYAESFV